MKNLLATVKREINAILSRRIVLCIMIIAPILACFLVCEIFKTGVVKDLPVAVYNADNSPLSRTIVRMVNATQSASVDYRVTSLAEGKNLLVEGKIYGFVLIPRHFQRDVYRGNMPEVVLYYNNQLLSIGGAVAKDITVALKTATAGVNLKKRLKKGAETDFAASQINLISVDEHIYSNPYLNYSYFLTLSILAQTFQALIVFLTIFAIGSEFKNATTKIWLETAGNSIITAVFGKLIPYFLIFASLMFITYSIYYFVYGGLFAGNIFGIAVATTLFILAYQAVGLLFIALTSNLRLSLSMGAFYTVLAFSFVGVTYPIIAMPKVAQIYSSLLPLKYYLTILIDQSIRSIPIKYDAIAFFALVIFILMGLGAFPLLQKNALNESKWGLS